MSPIAASQARPVISRRSLVAARSERQLLHMSYEGDLSAREELVHRFLPMTRRLAGRYRQTAVSQEDLEQVACVGLIKALDRYEPSLGSFVGYAVPTIVGELKRHLRDKGWGMRIPRSLQERFLTVNQAIEDLSGRLGRSPTAIDIARHTRLDIEDVVEALEASSAYTPAALDAPRRC